MVSFFTYAYVTILLLVVAIWIVAKLRLRAVRNRDHSLRWGYIFGDKTRSFEAVASELYPDEALRYNAAIEPTEEWTEWADEVKGWDEWAKAGYPGSGYADLCEHEGGVNWMWFGDHQVQFDEPERPPEPTHYAYPDWADYLSQKQIDHISSVRSAEQRKQSRPQRPEPSTQQIERLDRVALISGWTFYSMFLGAVVVLGVLVVLAGIHA